MADKHSAFDFDVAAKYPIDATPPSGTAQDGALGAMVKEYQSIVGKNSCPPDSARADCYGSASTISAVREHMDAQSTASGASRFDVFMDPAKAYRNSDQHGTMEKYFQKGDR